MTRLQLDLKTRNAYWRVVEECLEQFHSIPPKDAMIRSLTYRRSTEALPPGIEVDIIYHEEPFYLACSLAGINDPPEQNRLMLLHRPAYDSILDRAEW